MKTDRHFATGVQKLNLLQTVKLSCHSYFKCVMWQISRTPLFIGNSNFASSKFVETFVVFLMQMNHFFSPAILSIKLIVVFLEFFVLITVVLYFHRIVSCSPPCHSGDNLVSAKYFYVQTKFIEKRKSKDKVLYYNVSTVIYFCPTSRIIAREFREMRNGPIPIFLDITILKPILCLSEDNHYLWKVLPNPFNDCILLIFTTFVKIVHQVPNTREGGAGWKYHYLIIEIKIWC